ncbi:MAG: PP2C family protein-serine/threonine phosphatase [Treponema sp.]
MGLIVCTYFFAVLLFWNSTYLSVHQSKEINIVLNKFAVPAAAVALGIAFFIHLSYYERTLLQRGVSFLSLCCILLSSYYLLNISLAIPNCKPHKMLRALNRIIHIAGFVFIVFFMNKFEWNALRGFYFQQRIVYGTISAPQLFAAVYFVGIPSLAVLTAFIKVFIVKNNIYRQQLVLHGLAVAISLALWIGMIYIFRLFSWTFSLLPLGYILILVLDNAIFSVTRVFDFKQVSLGFIRFMVFTVFFSLLAGFLTTVFMHFIFETSGWFISIAVSCTFVLLFRDFIAGKLTRSFTRGLDYELALDNALQSMDYSQGRDAVLEAFPRLMKQYVTCKGLDILVTDDTAHLQTEYSDFGHRNTMEAHLPCFDFLLNQGAIVVTRNEILTKYMYYEIKDELLGIFDATQTEVLICIREGQKLIGCIFLAPKTHSAEYSLYDIKVLSNLYSYFFLIIYYLRNIAKQDITVTVDREIKMSDQIIGSIQKNQDKLDSPHFTMDSISYSAHQLGGDFIDFITLNERRAMFLIGDVAGKGLSASMSMVILKSVIHTYLQETSDFKELVVKLNRFVKYNLPRGTFFAGLFGIIDFPTNTIYYLNCGIPLMSMYIEAYRNVIEIQGEGRVLGFVKDIEPYLKVRKITMHKGDCIVMSTDGLLDAANLKGERFGSDRVGRILQEHNTAKVSHIARAIYNKLLDFILREIDDDVTILVLKYNE